MDLLNEDHIHRVHFYSESAGILPSERSRCSTKCVAKGNQVMSIINSAWGVEWLRQDLMMKQKGKREWSATEHVLRIVVMLSAVNTAFMPLQYSIPSMPPPICVYLIPRARYAQKVKKRCSVWNGNDLFWRDESVWFRFIFVSISYLRNCAQLPSSQNSIHSSEWGNCYYNWNFLKIHSQ